MGSKSKSPSSRTGEGRDDKYRKIFENLQDVYYRTDTERRFVELSPSVEAHTGYSREWLIGRESVILYANPGDRPALLAALDAAGRVDDYELLLKRKDNTNLYISLSARLVRDDDDRVIGIEGFFRDISRRKKAEEQLRKLSLATEQSPTSVMISDQAGRLEYVNKKFTEITGYSADEVIGMTPGFLKSGQHEDAFYRELWATLDKGGVWQGEFCNKNKRQELYWESARIAPIRDLKGKVTHFVAIKEDITEKKKLAEELEKAKTAAEVSSRAKSEFLANMSHEIRTPMNAIAGMVQLTLGTSLTRTQADYLHHIRFATSSLLRVLNDILDYSSIEEGSLHLERSPFTLDDILRHLRTVLASKAAAKGLEFVFDVDPDVPRLVWGDSLRLGQVLVNITSNAIKFTEKGTVVVRISQQRRVGNKVTMAFSVMDTGVGISADQQQIMFTPFAQGDSSSARKFGGAGLGLSISKHLVQMMNGDLGVESVPGKGTTFTFTADLEVREENTEPLSSVPEQLRNLRVLVVDDNPYFQRSLQRQLYAFSMDTTVVPSAEECLREVELQDRSQPFALVIMDYQLGEMNGIEATRALRALSLSAQPKVVMVTGFEGELLLSRAQEAGADAFVNKPIDIAQLNSTIEEIFGTPKISPLPSAKDTTSKSPGLISAIPRQPWTQSALPDHLPGLDIQHGLELASGNIAAYQEFLRMFVEEFGESVMQVEAALVREDFESVRLALHTLKGVAGTVGAFELHKVSNQLEQRVKGGEPLGKLSTRALSDELDTVLKSISSVVQVETEANVVPKDFTDGDNEALGELIRDLHTNLEVYNFVPLEDLDELAGHLPLDMVEHLVLKLRREVAEFAYDDALITLEKISQSVLGTTP